MESKFIISTEIEQICEQKAKEEYEIQKEWNQRNPQHEIDEESMINAVKSMINDKRLIVVKKEFTKEFRPGSDLSKLRFSLVYEYAEKAVKTVIDVDITDSQ